MHKLRIAFLFALLACVAPLLSTAVAAGIAKFKGCTLHEGFVNPCVVAGVDIGEALYTMGVMGWLMLFTLPFGILLLLAWIAVEIVHLMRRRRAE